MQIDSPFHDYYDSSAALGCPDTHYKRWAKVMPVPPELDHLAQHAFIQRTILEKSAAGGHLRTVQGISALGLCGRIYPFFFESSNEESSQYPWKTSWENPYDLLGSNCHPAGQIFAGYSSGGWVNPILRQWQDAFGFPLVLFLPQGKPNLPSQPGEYSAQQLLVNPQLEEISCPISPDGVVAELCQFFHGQCA